MTVVSLRRDFLFGDVVDRKMRLNDLGRIVWEEWFKTAALRPYLELWEDEFVVMPNHAHGIIWIVDNMVGARRRRAPTTEERFGKPVAGSIPTIIRAFKSAVTYRANRELTSQAGIQSASAVSGPGVPDNSANIWQRNYYEHIVRNQTDYERIAGYILANPSNWNEDDENQILTIK